MDGNPTQSAESIKSQLMEEWPDLFIEVEDGPMPVLKIYGARELFEKKAKERAEEFRGEGVIPSPAVAVLSPPPA